MVSPNIGYAMHETEALDLGRACLPCAHQACFEPTQQGIDSIPVSGCTVSPLRDLVSGQRR